MSTRTKHFPLLSEGWRGGGGVYPASASFIFNSETSIMIDPNYSYYSYPEGIVLVGDGLCPSRGDVVPDSGSCRKLACARIRELFVGAIDDGTEKNQTINS